MKSTTSFLFILCTLIFVAGSAFAVDERIHFWNVGVHPGLSLPGGTINNLQTESVSLRASCEYAWSKRSSAGFEVGHDFGHRLDGELVVDIDHDGIMDYIKATGNESVQINQLTAFLKKGTISDWGTWNSRLVRTFFIFGAGVYETVVHAGQYSLKGRSSGGMDLEGVTYPIQAERHANFGVNVGLGFDAQVFGPGRLGFDFRYHRIIQPGDDSEYYIPSLRMGVVF